MVLKRTVGFNSTFRSVCSDCLLEKAELLTSGSDMLQLWNNIEQDVLGFISLPREKKHIVFASVDPHSVWLVVENSTWCWTDIPQTIDAQHRIQILSKWAHCLNKTMCAKTHHQSLDLSTLNQEWDLLCHLRFIDHEEPLSPLRLWNTNLESSNLPEWSWPILPFSKY